MAEELANEAESQIQSNQRNSPLLQLLFSDIDAEVLDSLFVAMDNFRFALGTSKTSALHETVVKVPTVTLIFKQELPPRNHTTGPIVLTPSRSADLHLSPRRAIPS